MRMRITVAAVLLVLTTACSSALETLSPRYFYGAVVQADGAELCLADPRDGEPERERCFAFGDTSLPEGVGEGDLVRVRYQAGEGEDEWVAVAVEPVLVM